MPKSRKIKQLFTSSLLLFRVMIIFTNSIFHSSSSVPLINIFSLLVKLLTHITEYIHIWKNYEPFLRANNRVHITLATSSPRYDNGTYENTIAVLYYRRLNVTISISAIGRCKPGARVDDLLRTFRLGCAFLDETG
jgi:hypothetical protein